MAKKNRIKGLLNYSNYSNQIPNPNSPTSELVIGHWLLIRTILSMLAVIKTGGNPVVESSAFTTGQDNINIWNLQ